MRNNCTVTKDARCKNPLIAPLGRSSKKRMRKCRARDEGTRARLVVWQSDFYSQRVVVTEQPRGGDRESEMERQTNG